MKIVCFHLFNDYSGSPKVLHNILSGFLERGYEVELVTSKGGVLDSLTSPKLKRRSYNYRFSENPAVTMLRYAGVQVRTFFMAFSYAFSKDTVFYINTILPVGPAIAGRLTGKKVIYHYHENAFIKSSFYRMLAKGMQFLAHRIVCVSKYQASFLKRQNGVKVIPNALEEKFVSKLQPDIDNAFERKNVLMLSSLKEYKGTREFIGLAKAMPEFNFTLVINDTQYAIDDWLASNNIIPADNISIHPRSDDVAGFYNNASLVVNLSNPDLFIETFGLTALEAMACALPVIVPPVGGIAEMVTEGANGYKIDCHDKGRLVSTITKILNDKILYVNLAQNAYTAAKSYSRENMINTLISFLHSS